MHRLNRGWSGRRGGRREEKKAKGFGQHLGISWEAKILARTRRHFGTGDSIPGKPTRLKYRLNAKHFGGWIRSSLPIIQELSVGMVRMVGCSILDSDFRRRTRAAFERMAEQPYLFLNDLVTSGPDWHGTCADKSTLSSAWRVSWEVRFRTCVMHCASCVKHRHSPLRCC